MPRRYRRTDVDVFERMNTPLRAFPAGEGPPLMVKGSLATWKPLGLDQRVLVRFGEGGGAVVNGMVRSRAVIWARFAPGGIAGAYCYHAPPGPLRPGVHLEALARLNHKRGTGEELYVVLAARGEVAEAEERFFAAQGMDPSRIFSYSNALLPQFGVSGAGCVGEMR